MKKITLVVLAVVVALSVGVFSFVDNVNSTCGMCEVYTGEVINVDTARVFSFPFGMHNKYTVDIKACNGGTYTLIEETPYMRPYKVGLPAEIKVYHFITMITKSQWTHREINVYREQN